MSGVRQEKQTFGEIYAAALEACLKRGRVDERFLERELKIALPTAVKVMSVMELAGFLGAKERLGGYVFAATASDVEKALETDNKSQYLPLVEKDRDFRKMTHVQFLKGVMMPAILAALNCGGSMSVVFLQRKLGVVRERANEIYDMALAAGILGREDERNPGRRVLTIAHEDYDRIFARIEAL